MTVIHIGMTTSPSECGTTAIIGQPTARLLAPGGDTLSSSSIGPPGRQGPLRDPCCEQTSRVLIACARACIFLFPYGRLYVSSLYDVTSCCAWERPETPGPAHPASLGSRAPHTAAMCFLWAWKSMTTRLRGDTLGIRGLWLLFFPLSHLSFRSYHSCS